MKMALKIFVFALLSLLLPACNAVKCCANKHSNGRFLQLQQTSLPFKLCSYGVGPVFTQCVYKNNNSVPPPLGCPALVDAPVCPVTGVIHPKSNPGLCVTVLGTAVKVQTCNGANNQRFLFNQDTATRIRAAGTNLCLDAVPTLSSTVTLKTCTPTLRQIFLFNSAPNFILKTFFYGIQRSGSDLKVQVFSNANPLQKWTIFP